MRHNRRVLQAIPGAILAFLILASPFLQATPVRAEVPAGDSEYFIPGFSQDLRDILVDIDNDPVIGSTLHNVITISVGGDNTTVYYDHWENGYSTGAAGDEIYTAHKGDILTFESPAIPSNPRGASMTSCPGSIYPVGGSPAGSANNCYDGRDRIYVRGGAVSVAQAFWPTSSGTVYANAWEIYPVKPFQTSYIIPVGEDLATTFLDFEQVFVLVQASTNGTNVQINDPRTVGVDVNVNLNRGEVTHLYHIGKGTSVTANYPVQVQFIVGAFNANVYSESRSYTAVPSALWSSTYYDPIPGFAGGLDTELYIYNPTGSPLRIDFQDTTGSGFFNVPAYGTTRYSAASPNGAGRYVPVNSGVILRAHDGTTKFWAIGSQDTESADYNAGFTLIPDTQLTSEYFVSWAPGCSAMPCSGVLNTSPVFISPTVNNTTVYVDYGPADGVVDATYTLNRLQIQQLYDPDGDNTGMHIWANYPIAIVWAQNAGATLGNPAIDAGYTILPFNRAWMDTVVSLDKTSNPSSILPAIGQTSTFTLKTETFTFGLSGATVLDVLPAGWAYVAGNTTITLPGGGTITGAAADPVIAGQNLTWNDFSAIDPPDPDPINMPPSSTMWIVYQARTTAIPGAYSTNTATVTGTYGGSTYSSSDSDTVYSTQPDLTVAKTNNTDGYGAVGTAFTWSLNVSNGGSSGSALFTPGQVLLRDYLPTTVPATTYGAVTFTPGATPPLGPGTVSCSIAANILTCTATGGNVTLPINGSFMASFPVTPGLAGALVNPPAGGGNVCRVDPDLVNAESNEANNNCADTVTIAAPDFTVTKTNDLVGNRGGNGVPFTWTLTISNGNASGPGTFNTGQTILTDVMPAATYGAVTVTPGGTPPTGTGTVSCAIAGTTLTCTASGGTVILPRASSFTAAFSVTPAAANLVNPTGGVCQVDPNNNIVESNDGNNTCANTVTITAPDLTIAKSNNTGGNGVVGIPFTWSLLVSNGAAAGPARFTAGQTIVTDSLPAGATPPTYGAVTVTYGATAPTGTGTISCSIAANVLTCTASGGTVILPTGGTFTAAFSTTPAAAGAHVNPTGAATNCMVDPGNVITESSEVNNNCAANTVTVVATQPDLTIAKSNNVSNTIVLGNYFTWSVQATNGAASAPATFAAGNTILTDTLPTGATPPTYGAVSVVPGATPPTGTGTISCSISVANVLTCTASGGTVIFPAGGSFVAEFRVTPAATGAVTNAFATCVVDPGLVIAESNEGNNNCTTANTVTVTAQPNLSATKTNSAGGTYILGSGTGYFTWSVAMANAAGAGTATFAAGQTILTDDLPAGPTYSTITTVNGGSTGTILCAIAAGSLTCSATTAVTFPANTNSTVTFRVAPTTTGSLVNPTGGICYIDPANVIPESNETNNACANTVTVTAPDLTVTKTDNTSGNALVGTAFNWVLTAANGGTSPAAFTNTQVILRDPLPAGPTYGAPTPGNFTGITNSGNISCSIAGGILTCTANGATVTIGIGGSFTVTLPVTPVAIGTLANTATIDPNGNVTEGNETNNTGTDTVTVTLQANLGITKTDGAATYTPGGTTTYTIVASNAGPGAVTGATVTDTFPAEITSASWTCVAAGGATCTASGSGNINDTINIPVGGTSTYTVVANISASATVNLVNTATVSVPVGTTDPTPGNNSATDTDTAAPRSDLAVTKTDGTTTYTPGGSTTYTVVVSNAGPSNVTGATVTDSFPAAVTSATWTCAAAGGATCAASGSGNISDTINIPVGGTTTYTVVASISAAASGNLVNTTTVAAPVGTTDPTPGNNSATDTDTAAPSADLSITKTDGVASYTPGGSTIYTIVVSNVGPSNVISASVLDNLPAGISSATWTCTPTGGAACTASGAGNINDTVNIPVGQTLTYSVTANISAGATGNLVNTATVNPPGGTTDPTPGNNSQTDTDTATPSADLAITKTDGVATYTPGGTTTYTVVVSNSGPSNITGATVADSFPAAVTSATWTCAAAGGAACTASGSGNISDTINVPVGGTATYSITASISSAASGNLVNTATVAVPVGTTDPTPGNNSATDTDTASPSADLAITKSDGVATYIPGGSTIYTIVVSNAGLSNVTGATITDNLPAAITSDTWTCVAAGGATCTASGSGNISDTINIPVGGTATYTVTASISSAASGNLVNTATVAVPVGTTDPTPGNNSATDTDTAAPSADLAITKTDGAATYTPGGSTTYTIVVSNAGPSNVTGAAVTDTFPAAITSATWTCAAAGGATCAASGSGDISDTVDLPVGGTATYSVTASISAGATGNIINTASVAPPSGISDPNLTNNSATDTDAPIGNADLAVTKTDGTTTYTPGGSTTYTIVVSNAGPSNVTGATVTDNFPAAISASWTCATAGGASCGNASGSTDINETVNLPSGGSVTYTVTAAISAGASGDLVNTASVTSGVSDPTPGNNSATDTDTQSSSADLAVTKTDGTTTYTPGGSTTYTIVVSNAGPSNVTGATVTDNFPAAISASWTCATAGGASCGNASGSTDINETVNLPSGGSVTYTVTAAISAGASGDLVNTASVTSGVSDPTPGNNSATDTDTQSSSADLAVTKTDGTTTYTPGGSTTYTIVVSNAGPSNVTGATVTDNFPAAISASWTCATAGGASCGNASGSTDINETVNLPSGGSVTYTVTAAISAGASGDLVNTASVTSGVSDPTPGNNSATDTDTQSSSADLAVTKTDGTTTYTPGGSTTYTIVVSNAGPSNVTGATVTDNFPAAISASWTCATAGGASCGNASGSTDINETVNLPSGGSVTYTVTAAISAGASGDLVNTASVTSGVSDPTPGNNSATDTDTQSSSADLAVTKTDGTTTYTPGGSTTYTIVVSNAGPSNVTGATVTDNFPAAISASWTCATAGGASCGNASGSTDINETVNLPSGGSVTYTVTAAISAGASGDLVNTASVTSGVSDPTPGNNSATDTDTQSSSADLAVTKTDGTTTYTPGGSTTYTIVVSNAGPSNVTGATVTDNFPAAISASWTCATAGGASCGNASGSTDINETVNLPSGGSVTYTVTAAISAGASGDLVNTASVTSGVSDPTPGNNSATDTDTQSSSADLAVTKTDGTTTYTPGGSTTYTIVVSNAGPSNVTGATVTDNFPAAISASWTCATAGGASCGNASGSTDINETVNLPSGGSVTYTVTAAISAGASGDLVNTASVTSGVSDPTPGNNSATDTDTQSSSADLAVTKTDGTTTYTPGGSTTYTIVVSNAGPSNVTGATVTDNFPAAISASWTCATAGGASCGNASGSTDINETVNLPSGGSVTYTVTAAISAGASGDLVNTASVTSGVSDPTPGNNSATDTDTQSSSADLAVTKTDGTTTYTPGGSTTYTIVVSNAGPSNVTGATVTDNFPAAISASWTCATAGGASCGNASGSTDINETVNLPSGGSVTYTVTAAISAGASGDLVNTASVTSGVSDPTPGNNSATDTDTQSSSADLAVTKTDGTTTYTPGGSTTYTIVVSNAGPSNVTGATVTDNFPAAISASWTCATAGGASCGNASGSTDINETVNLPSGGSVTYTVTAAISAGASGDLVNTASVTSGVSDPTPGNNSATDTDTQSSSADLAVTKTDGTTTYTPGGSTTYTIVVSNAGPSNVTGATVTDNFPAAISASWTCATAGGASCGNASGSTDINETVNLPSGGSVTYTVTAAISAGASGDLVNTASVTSGVSDPTPGNNSATDTDTQSSSADLAVTKTDGTTTYTPGGSTTYTIVVSNAGPSNVTGATVTDNFPAAISASWTCATAGGASCGNASGSTDINETVNLPSGGSVTYTVTAAISAGASGDLVNTASVTSGVSDPTPGNNSATDTDTQSSSADLAVTKTDGTTTYTPGGSTTYTIVVSNAGPSNVTGATVTDNFPAAISASWTCATAGGASCGNASGSTDINETVNLPSGGSVTYTVTAAISAGASGDLVNTASVTSGVSDPTPGNNSATDTDTQSSSADLAVTKTDGTTTYTPGGSTTYTIVVSNAGPSNVTGATVTDNFPAAISASWTCATAGGASCGNASGSTDINETVNLPSGGSVTYTVTAAISAGASGDLVNTASVTSGVSDPTPGNNSATDTDTQSSSADLAVTKTDGTTTYTPGGSTTYTIVVSNAGPSNVTGATVTDNFPAAISASWTCATAGGASCGNASGSTDINETVNLPSGGSVTYTVTAAISAGASGDLVNTASVTSGVSDPTPGNNSATDTDTQSSSADLAVTKTDGTTTYTPGGSTTYTIVVSNAGPSNVTGATVTDNFPAAISASWTCATAGGASCGNASGSTDINETVNLPSGGSVTYTVTAAISAGASGDLVNTASVTSGVSDPTPGNNSATDTDTQSSSADLAVTKTDGTTTYTPGGSTTYTIVVSNAGPSDVISAAVLDNLPAEITSATWTCTPSLSAACTASGAGDINDTVNIPAGGTLTYVVTANISGSATGSLINTATVNPPGGLVDPTPGNNSTTDTDASVPGTISGVVWNDADASATRDGGETGIGGVTVTLLDGVGATVGATVTAVDGSYSFTALPPGDYTVVETDLPGYVSTTSNSVPVTLPAGGSGTADFGDYQLTGPVPAVINGTVYNDLNGDGVREPGEPGLGGVTVELLDSGYNLIATTTTSAAGAYSFPGLTPGTYTVRETDPATFISTTPNLVSVTLGSGATATVDFGDQTSGGATIADPALTKFGDPASAVVGDLVTYTITVTNTGNASAANVVVTDTKPAFLDILTVTISPNPGLTVVYAGNGFSIDFGTVAPADFYTITIVTRVNSLGIPPGAANNASLTTTSPTDRPFNNAGAANLVISIAPSTLPGTGFAPTRETALPPQPENLTYADLGDLWLEIPRLGQHLPIVGVPNQRAGWDVTWLGNEAGWLNGTAFPTWAGNSVLTGHVYLPNGKPGPFVNLHTLAWGDTVVVHLSGDKYIFQVRQTGQVLPGDLSILKHEDQSWLTLLTCRGYEEKTGAYRYRVYARAILIRVEADAAAP